MLLACSGLFPLKYMIAWDCAFPFSLLWGLAHVTNVEETDLFLGVILYKIRISAPYVLLCSSRLTLDSSITQPGLTQGSPTSASWVLWLQYVLMASFKLLRKAYRNRTTRLKLATSAEKAFYCISGSDKGCFLPYFIWLIKYFFLFPLYTTGNMFAVTISISSWRSCVWDGQLPTCPCWQGRSGWAEPASGCGNHWVSVKTSEQWFLK